MTQRTETATSRLTITGDRPLKSLTMPYVYDICYLFASIVLPLWNSCGLLVFITHDSGVQHFESRFGIALSLFVKLLRNTESLLLPFKQTHSSSMALGLIPMGPVLRSSSQFGFLSRVLLVNVGSSCRSDPTKYSRQC